MSWRWQNARLSRHDRFRLLHIRHDFFQRLFRAAPRPASAKDAPIKRRKSRRCISLASCERPSGNSALEPAVEFGCVREYHRWSANISDRDGPPGRPSNLSARRAVASYHKNSSSVTGAAIRQAAARIDVILPNELRALRRLVRRRAPVHVVNFRSRPDEILRLAVTFQTPLHVKRLRAICDRHLIDLAVAG